jgi:RimJ/RimL family protein N-acetyltransferase
MTLSTVRNFISADIPEIYRIQQEYKQVYPGFQIMPPQVYASPAFQEGQNVFCVIHPNGQVLGYAAIYPIYATGNNSKPHIFWAEMKASPLVNNLGFIKDSLLNSLLERSAILKNNAPERPAVVNFQLLPEEIECIAFLQDRQALHKESIYTMQRDLDSPIAQIAAPPGIIIRPWKMESIAEQAAYVQARNEAFPDTPIQLDEWVYFMQSQQWASGTNIAAFDGDQLAACMTVYPDNFDQAQVGYSEYIFTRPAWRGHRIALPLISSGLSYLQTMGLKKARLDVHTENRKAIQLYEVSGYQIIKESAVYSIFLE